MESNLKALLLAIVIATGLPSRGVASTVEEIATSAYWKRLLHYRVDILGRERSEIDDPSFFLSPRGSRESLAELRATLEAFRQPAATKIGRYEQHPQCVYPERFRFLSTALALKIPKVPCEEFNKWKSGLQVREVALVYAAPYLGNPASMFGHTFLRFKLRTQTEGAGSDLLDAGISFDADPTSDGGLTFAYKGLTGGYPGRFSIQPYYMKIKAYSQIENRGLWEFDLNLDDEKIERLLAHLWELGSTYLDYYFFDENCSYQLLALLEVANAEWNLVDHFGFKTVPLDTVRAVERTGAIVRARTRPALVAALEARIDGLSKTDRLRFEDARRHPRDGAGLQGDESVELLDALIEWNRYQSSNRMEGGRGFSPEFETEILVARASKPMVPALLKEGSILESTGELPQSGHRTSKASISFGQLHGGGEPNKFFGISYRPVLHDRLDPETGYIPFSTLELARTEIRYDVKEQRLRLENFTFAKVENFNARNSLKSAWSWMAALDVARPRDLDCVDCVMASGVYGLGVGTRIFSSADLFVALAKARAEYSTSFFRSYDQAHRFSPSIEALYMIRPPLFASAFKTAVEIRGEQFWYLSRFDGANRAAHEASATFAASTQHFELRLKAAVHFAEEREAREWSVSLGSYF